MTLTQTRRSLMFASLFMAGAAGQSIDQVTISQAVATAERNYPSVRVSAEQVAAAAAGINLARTAYLPRLDGLGQLNRATRNNVFGLLLPQSVIPSISGPVLGTNDMTNVWGSAVGVLVSWEPFDFGLRKANIDVADASRRRAEAGVARTQFEVAAMTADAFLTVIAAGQTVKAAQAGVDRAKVLEQSVGALARAELRPGADLSRAQAERAIAETQLAQAEQAVAVAQATLAQMTGAKVTPLAGKLLEAPQAPPDVTNVVQHPLALEQLAIVGEVKAREKALDRSYFPRFSLQGTSFARGTGARVDGSTGGAASGVGPNFQNWALGMSVTFPIMDFKSLREKKEIEAHNERGESARYDRVVRELEGQLERAKAQLEGARRVAALTPVQRKAARDAVEQATARYKSGLGTLIEVAEAQRLLTATEIDEALAQLNIWRAMLAVAAAQGNLQPFLEKAEAK